MHSPPSSKGSPVVSASAEAGQDSSTLIATSTPRTPRILSCVLCQQRKVKCDKKFPCSNCLKAKTRCVISTPAPPRRRRKKNIASGEDELLKKVRKYETLLKSYGESLDIVEDHAQAREDVPPYDDAAQSESGNVDQESDPESGFPDIGGLMLDACAPNTNLTALHPSSMNIFRLWQTFLENVNPIINISHAPTIQQSVLEASANLSSASKPMEALLFSIYSAAVNSLTNAECESMLGQKKLEALGKFHSATLRALQRVQFLRTDNMVVLQAFVLFLISARTYYDTRTQWVLSGVAVRIAQTMGLHRDPQENATIITPFEVEMRRRLWWAIVIVDSRLAAATGGANSILEGDFDTKLPLNVNDSDLSPSMRESPIPRSGTTEILFTLARYEVNNFLRTAANVNVFNGSWQKLGSPTIPIAVKDATIDGLANLLENKFVQYCDSNIPIHLMTIGLARLAVSKLRLVARHPRQFPGGITGMLPADRDMLFANSIMSIDFDNNAQTNPATKRFLWHLNNFFSLDGFVFMLSELRYRTLGADVDRAWELVYDVYTHHPEMANSIRRNPIYAAIGNLALKAWEERQFRLGTFQKDPDAPIPPFIQRLFALRAPTGESKIAAKRYLPSKAIDTLPDFINTGEYIEDLGSEPDLMPQNMIYRPQMQWDGTFPIDMNAHDLLDVNNLPGQIDWMNMGMPFEINASADPMMLFDNVPVDNQPMDWDFWNGIMTPGTGAGAG